MSSIYIVKKFVKFFVNTIRQILLILSYITGIGFTAFVITLVGKELIKNTRTTRSTWELYSGNADPATMY